MTEAEQRARVVAIAREWVGTRYVHQARIKGKAADCTFVAKVYEEAGLVPEVIIPTYSPQAHLNRSAAAYMAIVTRVAREIEQAAVQPGDLVLFNIARTFSHGAIVVDWPTVIHADLGARAVIEALGDQGNLDVRERKFFTLW